MRRLSLLFLLLSLPFLAGAGEPGRNLLTSKYEAPGVAASFVAGADWMPFPAYADRDGWAALFGDAAEIYIRRGEQAPPPPTWLTSGRATGRRWNGSRAGTGGR